MLEKFLKKSSWTDIVVSLIFILFGAMLIASPEMVQAMIAILLGAVFIAMGIFRLINYFASGKLDNYSLATGIVAMIVGIVIMSVGSMEENWGMSDGGMMLLILGINFLLGPVWVYYISKENEEGKNSAINENKTEDIQKAGKNTMETLQKSYKDIVEQFKSIGAKK